MAFPHETVQLPSPQAGDLDVQGDDFAAVRVGGAIDGFQVLENLAEGGMGAVFRVRAREGERELALKTPLPGGRGGSYDHRLKRFLREARLTARMDHDGVARVRDQGHCDGLPYFTVDLVDGTPLSERIYEEGFLPIVESVAIVESTARAAEHVHARGVVHRDLKPANILLRPDGSTVVIDFGLSRDALGIDPRITESGMWLGTPSYIAPEQALGEASRVDGRADVYSLGAILFELLTGLPPYGVGSPRTIFRALRRLDAKRPSELRPEVPECVDRVVMRALARRPEDRFSSARAFADALAALRAELEQNPPVEVEPELPVPVLRDDETARGWNEESSSLCPTLQVAEAEAEALGGTEAAEPAALAETQVTTRALAAGGARRRRRRAARRQACVRRAGDSLDVVARYLALAGPAVAIGVTLLLLL